MRECKHNCKAEGPPGPIWCSRCGHAPGCCNCDPPEPSARRRNNWERIGTHDLRLDATPSGGFYHVTLRDADDGDVIVVNEDDLMALRDRLTQIIDSRPGGRIGYGV